MSDDNVVPMKMAKAFQHLDPTINVLGGGLDKGFPSIGSRGKVFSLRYQGESYKFTRADDGTASAYIDVIIVGANGFKSRVYYPGPFDEDSTAAPTCRAVNEATGPDADAPEPQAKSCAICPRSVWATKPDGTRKPDCQEYKRLAVLLMPKVTARMLGAPLDEPVFFKVPPGSFKTLTMYGNKLVHQGLHHASVITRISFSQENRWQFEFVESKVLDDKEAEFAKPWLNRSETQKILGGGQSEMRVISPSKPARDEPEAEGLLETFGKKLVDQVDPQTAAQPANPVTPIKRGRPAKPKPVVADDDDELSVAPKSTAAKPAGVSTKTVEGMGFLDEEPTNAISDKVKAMLNKDLSAMISGNGK